MTFPMILVLVNMGMGLLLAVLEFRCWKNYCDGDRWIRLFYSLIGMYWVGIYLYIFATGEPVKPEVVQFLVRPGITITLAAMASWAIIQSKKT